MSEIYNEAMEPIANPDLTLGRLTPGTRTVHHDAVAGVEEVSHYEIIAEYPNGGKDVAKAVDVAAVKARDAWDEEIPIQVYVPYTAEELAEMEAQRAAQENAPTAQKNADAITEIQLALAEIYEAMVGGETDG
nr:MAG TPA: hypothetical protein [Caudoviricetes sp.]